MQLITSSSGRVAVVMLQGYLDLAGASHIRTLLADACHDRALVVVDMAEVTFIDSTVIGVLVGANNRCRAAACAWPICSTVLRKSSRSWASTRSSLTAHPRTS